MQDAVTVSDMNGARERFDQLGNFVRSRRPRAEPLAQAAAVHPLQRQKRLAGALTHLVHLHEMGMLHAGGHLRFQAKTQQIRRAG